MKDKNNALNPVPPSGDMVGIPINLKYPENVPVHYASNVVVQVSDHEAVISFFLPIFNPKRADGNPEEIRELEKNGLDANCVARIVVSRSFYPILVETLKRNMPTYNKEQLKEFLTKLTEEETQGE